MALRFGTISPREVVEAVGTGSDDGAAFVRQLAWRDWFAHLLLEEPSLPDRPLRREYERIAWRDDPDGLAAWRGAGPATRSSMRACASWQRPGRCTTGSA